MSLTRGNHFRHGLLKLIGHEADKAENHEPGKEAGGTISQTNDNGISEAVIGKLVVAGQGDQGSPTRSQREEDLNGGISPTLNFQKLGEVRFDVEPNPVHGSMKREAFDQ